MSAVGRRTFFVGTLAFGALGVGAGPSWAAPAKAVPAVPKKPVAAPKRLIVLDPGHGGSDPGALGISGTQEKGVVITVARDLRAELEATGRYRVLLTRPGDEFIPLRDRVARAQGAKADLFLSIHADWHPDPGIRGASVYTLSEDASDREAAALAARENRADMAVGGLRLGDKPDNVAKALVAMTQRGTVNDSRRLAETIVRTFDSNGVRLLPKTHRQAGFAVLTAPEIPAALIELGYLSNRQDEKLLTVRPHQIYLARALRASVDSHFGYVPPKPPATRKA